jgi:LPXTG-motif cell wall-anchored protein
VSVLVTDNGEPVQGARGFSQGLNYSDEFNIRPNTPFRLQFASPDHGEHTTGADGTFSFYSWPRTSIWIGATAQIDASTLNGTTTIDTSSGVDTAVRVELGTETSISDYANTPRLTSLSTNVALTPAVFDPNVQAYSVIVPSETESIDVAATAAEGNIVRIFNENLHDGWNHIAVSVTSTGSAFSRVYGIEAYRISAPPPVDSVPDSSVPANQETNLPDNGGQTETTTKTTLPPPTIDIIKALPVVESGLTTDTSFSSGEAVSVTYGGFQPNEFVQLIVASTPQVIGSGYADVNGFVTLTGEIPSSLAGGNHTLAAYAPESGIGFAQPITVTASVLPTTGSGKNDMLLTWVLMLTVAGILILAIRRRSSALLN